MLFRNIVRRISNLLNCERARRVVWTNDSFSSRIFFAGFGSASKKLGKQISFFVETSSRETWTLTKPYHAKGTKLAFFSYAVAIVVCYHSFHHFQPKDSFNKAKAKTHEYLSSVRSPVKWRTAHSQFQSLKVFESTNLCNSENVVRRMSKLQNCKRSRRDTQIYNLQKTRPSFFFVIALFWVVLVFLPLLYELLTYFFPSFLLSNFGTTFS